MQVTRKRIYLAGGFHSGWQTIVKDKLKGFEYLDPAIHGIENPTEYTRWDLEAVKGADVILANMEASNPAGYSLALEVGYAKALGKKIYFVDQIEDASISRYFDMVRECSDRVFGSLDEAVDYIAIAESY
jgi:nucleoside 2-deoxyribosyltransferase